MAYLSWAEKTLTDVSDDAVNEAYGDGFMFTRVDRGVMKQTRSLRIDLSRFELSSENRRILKKTDDISLVAEPIPYTRYHWSLGKLAKDFYTSKFGDGTFSANKAKEILTDEKKTNFNRLFIYHEVATQKPIGYTICHETDVGLHYAYPFYDLTYPNKNLGMGMMLKAILWAKEAGKQYIYLGSFQRPTDVYKLQFAGLEWFDGKRWQTETDLLKQITL